MNSRIKEIRKALGMSQEEFGKRLSITKTSISKIESGINNPSEQTLILICREFGINEDWIRDGKGEMAKELSEDDEADIILSNLIEDKENPLYDIIKGIMKTYNRLDDKSKTVIKKYSLDLIEELKKKRED